MLSFGSPLAAHMAVHITAMNFVAPAIIIAYRHWRASSPGGRPPPWLGAATGAQLAIIWFWHAPAAMLFAMSSIGGLALMHTSLLLSACWFWNSVLGAVGASPWRSILALLVTAKLFCLLGVLLVFAPRAIYPILHASMGQHPPLDSAMADQQLAGLLMLIACPLTYLAAGIAIAARWVLSSDATAPEMKRVNAR